MARSDEIRQIAKSCKNDLASVTACTGSLSNVLKHIEKNVSILYSKFFSVEAASISQADLKCVLNSILASVQEITSEKQHLDSLATTVASKQDLILSILNEDDFQMQENESCEMDDDVEDCVEYSTVEESIANCDTHQKDSEDCDRQHGSIDNKQCKSSSSPRDLEGNECEDSDAVSFCPSDYQNQKNKRLLKNCFVLLKDYKKGAQDNYESVSYENGLHTASKNNLEIWPVRKAGEEKQHEVQKTTVLHKQRIKAIISNHHSNNRTENLYECFVCKQSFKLKKFLMKHMSSHKMRNRYKCTECPKSFLSRMSFRCHMMKHSGESPMCDACGKKFFSIYILERHKKLHCRAKLTEEHVCAKCGMTFSSRKLLYRHRGRHKYDQERLQAAQRTCDLCIQKTGDSRTFNSKGSLRKHKKAIHEGIRRAVRPKPTEKSFHCTFCSKSFFYQNGLRAHLVSCHPADGFICSDCNETFDSKQLLKSHKMEVHRDKVSIFICPYCGKQYTTKHQLAVHLSTHSDVKPYVCDKCDKAFHHPAQLKAHLPKHDLRFSCELCGQLFAMKSYLQLHLRSHRNERPFQCQFCEKTFIRQSNCRDHEKIHLGEKNFSCEYCQKSFVTNPTLKRHLRIHTGEKPYKCGYCDASFNQSGSRNTHIEKQHGITLVKKVPLANYPQELVLRSEDVEVMTTTEEII